MMEVDTDTTDKSDSFVIKATNVPREFFENRDVAKRYFRRFGKVKLVMFKPKRNCLLIEYANEDSMLNALEVAGEYNGHVFSVTRDTQAIIKKKKVKKDPDPDWTDDPEVRAELEAMGAFGSTKTYNLRPEAMNVDPVEVDLKAKQLRWKVAARSPKPQKKKAITGKELISGEQSDLANIIKQQALTIEDKYKILDARDKLIRIKMKKNIELSKVKATVGTCPDMCPEKERLMRETQHQVALYEQEEGGRGMNPRLAVKQYSRSSADQEAPLPQELRPVSVLQMTMGYLMHRIMGLCENPDVNIAEWYHFLWDRTRGIRKDITQQELCCQGSVELVEQCARFHIFCSARLVAEDPSVFDQKINTENLTKCLQTLKYMYHDLQLKRVSCRNEPEFRAYIILLNLNDGNFMWEVQQLAENIQQSREVKFALEVYSSLDKRNYVKFFKLVNSTTFLNACILVRYFIQVRISAIKTLLKSYSPRVSQVSLPVQYLTKILGFESTEATIEFFESYGLFTNVERTRISLDRPSFSQPEFPYILDRAINLVESKRQHSIGEVVCGRELPPKLYEYHTPQNSFDENGYLKFTLDFDEVDSARKEEPIKIVEKREKDEEQPRPSSSPITVQVSQAPSIFAPPKQNTSVFAKSIFTKSENDVGHKNVFARSEPEKVFTTSSLWSQPVTTKTSIFGSGTNHRTIFGGDAVPLVPITKPEIPPEEKIEEAPPKPQIDLEQKRKEEELKRRKEEEEERMRKELEEKERKRREEMKRKLQQEEEKRRLEEAQRQAAMKKKLMEEQKRKEQERRKNIEIKAAVSNVISDLLDGVEETMKQLKLAEIARRIHDRKLRKVVAKWRENTRRKRKRKALDFEPMWYGPKSVREEAEELRTNSQSLVLASMKRYKRGKPFEVQLNEEDDVSKIDLSELTYKLLRKKFLELDRKLHNEMFWKVTISVPNELEYPCGLNHLEKVLDNYIKWEKRGNTTVTVEQSKSLPTITYCLEKQKGLVVNTRNDTNGFIFIANDFNDDLCKRIVHNFENYGVFVKIPIVLVLQTYSEHKSNLKALIDEGIISDYLILVDKFTSKNLVNLVEEALIFLSTRTEKTPPLEMDTLKSFLVKYLCNNLWKRANSFAKWNSNYKDCLKNPNTVIYLHNEALDRLKKILLDESCREYSKFPEIFKEFLRSEIPESLPCDYKYFPSFWDNPSYIKHIEAVLDGLSLPKFLDSWPPGNQRLLEMSVSKYCERILEEPGKSFYKVMSVLLRSVDASDDFSAIKDVVWTDVVELLALEKLSQTNFSLYGTGFVNKSIYNQLIVVYDVNILSDYVKSDWFYVNNPVVKQKILQMLQDQKDEVVVVDNHTDDENIDLDAILAKIQQPIDLNVGKIKSDLNSCKRLLGDLEDTVVIHKRILEKSGHLLKSIIEKS